MDGMVDEIQIGMDKTFEILDKVDIFSLYDIHKQIRVCELMDKVEGFVKNNSTLRSMMDDSFENEFFNFVNECEFIDYLTERYGNNIRFNEITSTYTYLSAIAKRPLNDEMLFAKGWKTEMSGHDYVFKHKDMRSFEIESFDHNGTSVYYVHDTNICFRYEEDLDAFVEMANKLDRNRN